LIDPFLAIKHGEGDARRSLVRGIQLAGQLPHPRFDVGLNLFRPFVLRDGAQDLLPTREALARFVCPTEGLLSLLVVRREVGRHRLHRVQQSAWYGVTARLTKLTRASAYTNGAVLLLTWRMPYHAEHHCFPSVPFHALAKLNALIGDRLQVTASGYLFLHRDRLRQFRTARAAGKQAARP
jgi:hypothetical protein